MVTIRMSPRGGILIGSVKDKATGKPIHEARVMYQAVDIGNSGTTSADGNFRLPVPTGTELIVVVSAKGYKSWFYTDPSDSSRPVVRLDSGEQRVLDVELVPSSNE